MKLLWENRRKLVSSCHSTYIVQLVNCGAKRGEKEETEECSRHRHSRNNGPTWSLDVTLSHFTELKERVLGS